MIGTAKEARAGTVTVFRRFGGMGEKDGNYFASREERERAMSREAPNESAAAAHAEMAERYEALAAVFGAKSLGEVPPDYPKINDQEVGSSEQG